MRTVVKGQRNFAAVVLMAAVNIRVAQGRIGGGAAKAEEKGQQEAKQRGRQAPRAMLLRAAHYAVSFAELGFLVR